MKSKKVYVILEEWVDHTCGGGTDIIDVYNDFNDAKNYLEEVFNEDKKIYTEKFGEDNFEIHYKSETCFTLQHDEFKDYNQIKIVEKMLK